MKFVTDYEVDFEVGPIAVQGEVPIALDYANDEDWDWDFDCDFKGDNPRTEPAPDLLHQKVCDETFQTALRARLERSDHFHEAMVEAIREHIKDCIDDWSARST